MKKVLSALLVVAFVASAGLAAAQPQSVTMKAKNGNVTLDHKKHAASGDCKACHGEGTPAKLTMDKATAHKICIDCHKAKAAGPTKCGECHKK